MDTIIILGEEYWFANYGMFSPASFLLQNLQKYKKSNLNYIIIQNPSQLISTINSSPNITAFFLFQDVLSDANLNNKTILQMKNYLNKLSNQIYIYPGVEITDTFGSKKYYETLVKKIPWSSLPHSRVLSFPNYKSYTNDYKIKKIIWKNVQSLWKIFDKVVVKKGYSYEGKQVVFWIKMKLKIMGILQKNSVK